MRSHELQTTDSSTIGALVVAIPMTEFYKTLFEVNWGGVVAKVVIVFIHCALVVGPYKFAKHVALPKKDEKVVKEMAGFEKLKLYFLFVGTSLFLSFLSAASLGTHTERSPDPDEPAEVIVDWEPTAPQRWERGAKVFLVIFPPMAFGVYRGFKEQKKLVAASQRLEASGDPNFKRLLKDDADNVTRFNAIKNPSWEQVMEEIRRRERLLAKDPDQ